MSIVFTLLYATGQGKALDFHKHLVVEKGTMFVGLDKCTQVREEMSLSTHLQFIEVMKKQIQIPKKGGRKTKNG